MNKNRKLVTEKTYYSTKTASGTSQRAPFRITAGEVKNHKDRLLFRKYTNPFTKNPKFSEKRFSRYVSKVAEILLEFNRTLYPNQRLYNFNEWYIEVLNYYFHTLFHSEDKKQCEYDILNLVDTYAVPFAVYFVKTKENMINYLADPYSTEDDLSVNEIITRELRNACKKYLAKRSVLDPELTEDNYLAKGLPDTSEEKLNLMEDILNRCIVSIEHICTSDISMSLIESIKNEALRQAFIEIEAKDARIQELEKEVELSCFQAKEEKKEKEKWMKQFQENLGAQKLHEVSRVFKESKKKTARLQNENHALHEKLQERFPVLRRTKKKQPELDRLGNYIFLSNSEVRMAKRIVEEFPNSRIISGNKKLNVENVDMVIAMTRSIAHAWYYGVKKQCKKTGIPFIHCPSTNMEELKLLIQTNQPIT